jgi:hypothetical protein
MEMVWQVEVRPLVGWSFIVEPFISTVISALARNFKVHVPEPCSTVKLAPRRGKGESFGQVPKETWQGGVFAAHLSDQRSTVEQTTALLHPWTWGRSANDNGEGERWTTGYI